MDPNLYTPDVLAFLRTYAAADQLAICYSRFKKFSLELLHTLGFLSVLILQIYGTWSWTKGLLIYFVSVIVLSIYAYWTRRRNVEKRTLDFRALAESLRVQIFMKVARIPVRVDDHFIRQQHSELQWISYAIRSLNLGKDFIGKADKVEKERYNQVYRIWVLSQTEFYSKKCKALKSLIRFADQFSIVMIFIGLSIAGFMLFYPLDKANSDLKSILSFVMGMTIFASLLMNAYLQFTAYREMLRSYQRLNALFREARRRLDRQFASPEPDLVKCELILSKLAREALKRRKQLVGHHAKGTQAGINQGIDFNEVSHMNINDWESMSIFVSSTFRDMQSERDYLHQFVFPELEERLKARRCHLEPVDLRWGAFLEEGEEQEAHELHVLKVCFEEIDRSKPFLVILLGDRYGWIPSDNRLGYLIDEAFLSDIVNRSITELEIQYGLFRDPGNMRCYVYIRQLLPYEEMDLATAENYNDRFSPDPVVRSNYQKLVTLKDNIRAFLPADRVKEYTAAWDPERKKVTGLYQWGREVLEDIWNDMLLETKQRSGKRRFPGRMRCEDRGGFYREPDPELYRKGSDIARAT